MTKFLENVNVDGTVDISGNLSATDITASGNVNLISLSGSYRFGNRSDLGLFGDGNYGVSLNGVTGVRINIDSNNNNVDSNFEIAANTSSFSGGNVLFSVNESSGANVAKDLTVSGLSNQAGIYSTENSILRIINPKGGRGYLGNGAITGAIKVSLPINAQQDRMIRMTVDIFNYSTDTSCTLLLGGYVYTPTGGAPTWLNQFSQIIASSESSDYRVRFGHDGTRYCFWIGEVTTSWSYPAVAVSNLQISYATQTNVWQEGWSISLTTAFTASDSISRTQTNNFPYADWNKLKGKPTDLATTSDIPTDYVDLSTNQTVGGFKQLDTHVLVGRLETNPAIWFGSATHRLHKVGNNISWLYDSTGSKKIYHEGNLTPDDYLKRDGSLPMTGDLTVRKSTPRINILSDANIGTSELYLGEYGTDTTNYGFYLKYDADLNIASMGTDVVGNRTDFLSVNRASADVNFKGKIIKSGSSDSYMLLGGGGTKLLSDFALASDYVKKSGDSMSGNLTGNKNFLNDWVINSIPEGALVQMPSLYNDIAYTTLRGGSVTTGTATVASVEKMFDGTGGYAGIDTSQFGTDGLTPVVIEINLPETLYYGAYCGLSFGNANWRCLDVKIEAFSQGAWVVVKNVTNFNGDTIFGQIPGNSAVGTNALRITLIRPNAYVRIAHVWATDYNSPLGKSLYLGRDGGNMYGNTNWTTGSPQVNGVDVWHPGNDGVGSGLVADYLGAIHTYGTGNRGLEIPDYDGSGEGGRIYYEDSQFNFYQTGGASPVAQLRVHNGTTYDTVYHTGNLPTYDNYQSWNLKTNGVQRTTVQSGGTLDLVAGAGIAITYEAGGVARIADTYGDHKIHGIGTNSTNNSPARVQEDGTSPITSFNHFWQGGMHQTDVGMNYTDGPEGTGSAGGLLNIITHATSVGQIFIGRSSKKMYFRDEYGGWSNWKEVASTDWVTSQGYLTSVGSHTHLWADITDKPTTFTPSAHSHAAGDITSGILDIARIPTGTTSSTVALGDHTHSGYALTSHEHDRTYITDSRGAQRLPSYYDDRYAQWDFQSSTDTQAGGDGWHGILTVSKWGSWDSSHRQEQLIFTGDDLKRRTATSDTAWGSMKTIWDSGNLTNVSQLNNDAGYSTLQIGTTSTTAAAGNHTHNYDNYNHWRLNVNGTYAAPVISGYNVNFAAGTGMAISYSAGTLTFNATDTGTVFNGGTINGDILIDKNNPWLTLDSSGSGGNGVEQGAGISIGESGYKGGAALHLTYTGDGYSHIGMGAVNTTTGLPQYKAMEFFYTNNVVKFMATPNVNGTNVALANHTHSEYAAASHTHSEYLTTTGTAAAANLIKVNDYNSTTLMRVLGSHQTGGSDNVYSTAGIYMNCSSNILYAADFAGTSDRRLKDNIKPYSPKEIKGEYKTFNFKTDNQLRVGRIAQELEIDHPEFVRTLENGSKSISYQDLHSAEIAYLKDKVDQLEKLINKLIK